MRHLELEVDDVEVRVTRKRIKRIYLRVVAPDGSVEVSAPTRIEADTIAAFVRRHLPWIAQQRHKLEARLRQSESRKGLISLWGEDYHLVFENGPDDLIQIEERRLKVSSANDKSASRSEKRLEDWLRRELEKELLPLIRLWEERMGVEVGKIRIRRMTSRWGSCTPHNKGVTINLELVHTPLAMLEYIVVHELAHLFVRAHDRKFYAILDRYLPDWRSRRRKLRDYAAFKGF